MARSQKDKMHMVLVIDGDLSSTRKIVSAFARSGFEVMRRLRNLG